MGGTRTPRPTRSLKRLLSRCKTKIELQTLMYSQSCAHDYANKIAYLAAMAENSQRDPRLSIPPPHDMPHFPLPTSLPIVCGVFRSLPYSCVISLSVTRFSMCIALDKLLPHHYHLRDEVDSQPAVEKEGCGEDGACSAVVGCFHEVLYLLA